MVTDFEQIFKIEHRTRVCNELEVRARFCEDDDVKEILLGLWNTEKNNQTAKKSWTFKRSLENRANE